MWNRIASLFAPARRPVSNTDVLALRQNIDQLSQRLAHQSAVISKLLPLAPDAMRLASMPEIAPATAYTFEQLLDGENIGFVNVLCHIHIPKVGGHSISGIAGANGYTYLPYNAQTKDFFDVIDEGKWRQAAQTKAGWFPCMFVGHYKLGHSILTRIPLPFAVIATIRDPMERFLSIYNFTARHPSMPWHEEVCAGQMSFIEVCRAFIDAQGPQYSYFDDNLSIGRGASEQPPEQCLRNLLEKVSVYGLTGRTTEFSVLFGHLFRRSLLTSPKLNSTENLRYPQRIPPKKSMTAHECKQIEKMFAGDLWFFEEAKKEYERRLNDPRLKAVFSSAMPVVKAAQHLGDQMSGLTLADGSGRYIFRR